MSLHRLNYAPLAAHRWPPERVFLLTLEAVIVLGMLAGAAAMWWPVRTGGCCLPREVAAHTDVAVIATAIDAFEVDVNRELTEVEGLDALICAPSETTANWQG